MALADVVNAMPRKSKDLIEFIQEFDIYSSASEFCWPEYLDDFDLFEFSAAIAWCMARLYGVRPYDEIRACADRYTSNRERPGRLRTLGGSGVARQNS
jgi:hypothetical protein